MTYQTRSKYVWAIPLVGAILTLIGFLTPMIYISDHSGSIYFWMWDLTIGVFSGFPIEIVFIEDPDVLYPSIIYSVLVFICVIVLFISVVSYKRSIVDNRTTEIASLSASIVTIICTIIWMVTLEVAFSRHRPYSFWDITDPHFGLFGLFIGSG
ncbi:MAG: hypothetical protein ACFFA3_21780, partial [Promethearchaeota archaeon]